MSELVVVTKPYRGLYIQIPGTTCVVCDGEVGRPGADLCCGPLCYARVREYQQLIRQNVRVFFSAHSFSE